jgi:hypothetical protein
MRVFVRHDARSTTSATDNLTLKDEEWSIDMAPGGRASSCKAIVASGRLGRMANFQFFQFFQFMNLNTSWLLSGSFLALGFGLTTLAPSSAIPS